MKKLLNAYCPYGEVIWVFEETEVEDVCRKILKDGYDAEDVIFKYVDGTCLVIAAWDGYARKYCVDFKNKSAYGYDIKSILDIVSNIDLHERACKQYTTAHSRHFPTLSEEIDFYKNAQRIGHLVGDEYSLLYDAYCAAVKCYSCGEKYDRIPSTKCILDIWSKIKSRTKGWSDHNKDKPFDIKRELS